MFSQKKKRSKGLLFLIPVLLVFLAGLGLNAFMEGGAGGDGKEGEEGNSDDRLVNAGYAPDADEPKLDAADGDDDEYAGSASSGVSEKGGNISSEREYTDNIGKNNIAGQYSREGEDQENMGSTDEYYYGSDPYSEMYGERDGYSGYSGYRAVSEDNTLVIYKYSNGTVVSEKRTDVQTDMLPEYDREMLENGIDMSSESDVDELLQDYEG